MTPVWTPQGTMLVREHPDVPANEPHVIGGVSRRTNLPSFLTRTATLGARWSHMGCVDHERGDVIEALWRRGVVRTPIEQWIKRYPSSEFFRTSCPEPAKALALWRQAADENWEYDEGGALGTVWRTVRFQDPSGVFCNELFEEGLRAGGRRRYRLGGGVRYPPMDSWLIL